MNHSQVHGVERKRARDVTCSTSKNLSIAWYTVGMCGVERKGIMEEED
jgi:hypothetical protein